MTLQPLFSLTPLNPRVYTYDPAHPDAPYALARLTSFGGITSSFNPYRLENQFSNNALILGGDPVDPAEQTISDLSADFYRRCTLRFYFYARNVTTENQYLLLFSLRSYLSPGTPGAQFFVGTDLVRSEEVSGQEQVAILLDVPGDGIPVYVYVRLASASPSALLGFQGMDCYLL